MATEAGPLVRYDLRELQDSLREVKSTLDSVVLELGSKYPSLKAHLTPPAHDAVYWSVRFVDMDLAMMMADAYPAHPHLLDFAQFKISPMLQRIGNDLAISGFIVHQWFNYGGYSGIPGRTKPIMPREEVRRMAHEFAGLMGYSDVIHYTSLEERYSHSVVSRRLPLDSSKRVADLIIQNVSAYIEYGKKHPAPKTETQL